MPAGGSGLALEASALFRDGIERAAEDRLPRAECVVAMSGGVDSSMAAALLLEEGREVMGITLRLTDPGAPSGTDPHVQVADQASGGRRAARALGIAHLVLDAREAFCRDVIRPFAAAFAGGRTPNPCVLCNAWMKFGGLLRFARESGARLMATGHYARVVKGPDGLYRLLRGRDQSKDQSYFLYRLGQEELSVVSFPLGDMTKSEVRARARRLGLEAERERESQDICFAGGMRYDRLVERHIEEVPPPGRIVHLDGRALGGHGGVHRYTVGQRRGLGIASSEPLYVVRIDREKNELVVGSSCHLESSRVALGDVSWILGRPPSKQGLTARVRYRHEGAPATLEDIEGDEARVLLGHPVRGPAPGQAMVFYDGDEVLGGGTIEEVG